MVGAGTAEPDAVLSALWDLVWAGEVTNDTLAPLRSFVAGVGGRRGGGGGGRSGAGRGGGGRRHSAVGRRRPRPGQLSRLGPPAGAGRWSLVAPALEPLPTPTEATHARALQLLERHGVLTREGALAEGVEGGFAGVYGVLRLLEERGRVRRGYFVAGLGGAQFALPGAVDRLRGHRADAAGHLVGDPDGLEDPEDLPSVVVLAAVDPAQPFGATLGWPETRGRPSRSAGAYVVIADGQPLVELERGARSVVTFPGAADDLRWIDALQALVKDGRLRQLEIRKIDGVGWDEAELTATLLDHGFQPGFKGPIYRP